jgi:hypothetical protein
MVSNFAQRGRAVETSQAHVISGVPSSGIRRVSARRMNFRFNFQTAKFFRQIKSSNSECASHSHPPNIRSRLAAQCVRAVERISALRAWGMPGAQCTRSLVRALRVVRLVSAQVFTARCTENARHSRTRWCYGLCRALLGEVLCCPRHPADEGFVRPGWADEPPRDLQPASGVGPHDLTVRRTRRSSCATFRSSQARRDASCPANDRPRATRAASTASHPASVTIAIRPSVERDGGIYKVFRETLGTRMFFSIRLDRAKHQNLPDAS